MLIVKREGDVLAGEYKKTVLSVLLKTALHHLKIIRFFYLRSELIAPYQKLMNFLKSSSGRVLR